VKLAFRLVLRAGFDGTPPVTVKDLTRLFSFHFSPPFPGHFIKPKLSGFIFWLSAAYALESEAQPSSKAPRIRSMILSPSWPVYIIKRCKGQILFTDKL
jgi:hypothetical protein